MHQLKIGDWVTQYSAGYWQLIDIKPKYANENRNDEYGNHKKGDHIGYWAVLKKGFTKSMKFRVAFDYCDIDWCNKISVDEEKAIYCYFSENTKHLDKFNNTEINLPPTVTTLWINLDKVKLEIMKDVLLRLPDKFTFDEFLSVLNDNCVGECISKPPTNHCINLLSKFPWDVDNNFDLLFFEAELH